MDSEKHCKGAFKYLGTKRVKLVEQIRHKVNERSHRMDQGLRQVKVFFLDQGERQESMHFGAQG